MSEPVVWLTIFVLSVFVGVEVISKVSSTLHTPLMSGANAIHGIILLGAILVTGYAETTAQLVVGLVAVVLAAVNMVGGPARNVEEDRTALGLGRVGGFRLGDGETDFGRAIGISRPVLEFLKECGRLCECWRNPNRRDQARSSNGCAHLSVPATKRSEHNASPTA